MFLLFTGKYFLSILFMFMYNLNMSKMQNIVVKAIRAYAPGIDIVEDYRPEWLLGMEIDIFIPSKNIAIEVQGKQHYLWCPDIHKTIEDFHKQRTRDKLKYKICQDRKINIIKVKVDRKEMGRLARKLRNGLKTSLKRLPKDIMYEWKDHLKSLSYNMNKKWPAFKVKINGIVPINRFSSDYLKTYKPNENEVDTLGGY